MNIPSHVRKAPTLSFAKLYEAAQGTGDEVLKLGTNPKTGRWSYVAGETKGDENRSVREAVLKSVLSPNEKDRSLAAIQRFARKNRAEIADYLTNSNVLDKPLTIGDVQVLLSHLKTLADKEKESRPSGAKETGNSGPSDKADGLTDKSPALQGKKPMPVPSWKKPVLPGKNPVWPGKNPVLPGKKPVPSGRKPMGGIADKVALLQSFYAGKTIGRPQQKERGIQYEKESQEQSKVSRFEEITQQTTVVTGKKKPKKKAFNLDADLKEEPIGKVDRLGAKGAKALQKVEEGQASRINTKKIAAIFE